MIQDRISYFRSKQVIRVWLSATILLFSASAVQASNWGGNVRVAYSETDRDTARSYSIDQRYRIHFSATRFSAFRYSGSATYRILRSAPEGGGVNRREEIQPYLNAIWSTPYYRWSGDFVYRQYEDDNDILNLVGRKVTSDLTTTFRNLPRFFGRYEWLKNVNSLELLGIDTRQQAFTGGTNLNYRRLNLQYQYSDRTTKNRRSGFEQISRQHMGIMNNLLKLHSSLSLGTNYQINHRNESEKHDSGEDAYLMVTSSAGLYADDPSPAFDELASTPQLIDRNLILPVIPEIDLAGEKFHNIGLDFGTAIEIDRLDLYVDTLANPSLQWAIYISDDNLTWTLHSGLRTYFFSEVFDRYEFEIARVTTRYIKLINEPASEIDPILVTELQGLVRRESPDRSQSTTDHRASADLRFQPASWLNAGAGAGLYRRGASLLQPGRDEDSYNALVRIRATERTIFSGQYFYSFARVTGSNENRTDQERFVVSAEREWDRTLKTTLSLNRQKELTNRLLSRRSDGIRLRTRLKLLPELQSLLDASYSEDHRFTSEDQYNTRQLIIGLNSQPTPRSNLSVRGTWVAVDSRSGSGTPFRRTFFGEASYRLTSSIRWRGNSSVTDESRLTSLFWTSQLNWTVTRKLNLGASARGTKTETESVRTTQLYTLQGNFQWSAATRTTVSYSYNDDSLDIGTNSSSLRLSFETRF